MISQSRILMVIFLHTHNVSNNYKIESNVLVIQKRNLCPSPPLIPCVMAQTRWEYNNHNLSSKRTKDIHQNSSQSLTPFQNPRIQSRAHCNIPTGKARFLYIFTLITWTWYRQDGNIHHVSSKKRNDIHQNSTSGALNLKPQFKALEYKAMYIARS